MQLATDFPEERVIGCQFASREGLRTYRGIITTITTGYNHLFVHAKNVEVQQSQEEDNWAPASEVKVFAFSKMQDGTPWEYTEEGNIQIFPNCIGSFTIFLS